MNNKDDGCPTHESKAPAHELAEWLDANRVGLDNFIGWMKTSGRLDRAATVYSLDDIDGKCLAYLLADKASLSKCIPQPVQEMQRAIPQL